MVRVGVDESLSEELLTGFPPEAQIVRIPKAPAAAIDVDLWILPFARKEAEQTFARLRGVRVVQSLMAGVDWITPWLPKHITLCDGRGIHDISASEWVVGVILASMKRLPHYRDLQAQQQWRGFARPDESLDTEPGAARGLYRVLAEDIAGKHILIVGYGSIGQAIEARLAPFGVTLTRIARGSRAQDAAGPQVHAIGELPALLPLADVVVLIVPLTEQTRGLIGERELALMKRGALLVNAARGPVVDTAALIEALGNNRLRAALDVTDPEPLPAGHPLWSAPNCLITPHIGGSTPEFIRRAFRFAAAQVERLARGEPLHNIVGEAGY
ncbi:MAG: 2-hydroxyacid dehydrogenase [Acidobacteriota bacterium]|nr:2-hydroxyacid dehydrogenase [Acidobacteriota bacterium]